jgi:23S rRNA (cytosine1962-C5)-methyltransferase
MGMSGSIFTVEQEEKNCMSKYSKVVLKPGKEQSLKRLHPWIFSGAIKSMDDKLAEGEITEVYSNEGEYLAIGHYQKGSIAIRILSFEKANLDQDFFTQTILSAWELRKASFLYTSSKTNVFRLINGEGDALPGLIIDYYNGHLVMQLHSVGMYKSRNLIVNSLKEIIGSRLKSIYDKSSGTLPFKAGLELKDEYLHGQEEEVIVSENGHLFTIEAVGGQKTGFFIDQRDNRKLLGEYSSGRRVLNMFSYSGGFSVYALKGGADIVHSVDSSAKAIDLAERNVELNSGKDKHVSFATDVYSYFSQTKEEYDLIVLDPPAFAKHHNVLTNALQGYKKLNRKAIDIIQPGGIIFTFSCSQAVSREDFKRSVFSAAAYTGRKVRILHQLSQPSDHPVSIYHPEGEYLKGLVLRID